MSEVLQIANTIRDQIKATDWAAMAAWGSSKLVALPNDGKRYGGLQFNVRGAKLQGKVRIELMPSDTYTVSILNRLGTVKKTLTDIYCDQLMEVIDSEIER